MCPCMSWACLTYVHHSDSLHPSQEPAESRSLSHISKTWISIGLKGKEGKDIYVTANAKIHYLIYLPPSFLGTTNYDYLINLLKRK